MVKDKANSIKWAIDELTNQREQLEGKLQVARKRDETSALIEEVFAQKEALQTRIAALEDGLKISSELVEMPVSEIENEVSKLNDKLEIAQERLESLEQEEYFAELGNKLNRSIEKGNEIPKSPSVEDLSEKLPDSSSTNFENTESVVELSHEIIDSSLSGEKNPTAMLMKTTSNRVTSNDTDDTDSGTRISQEFSSNPVGNPSSSANAQASSLEETASRLGVEPEFLKEKGIQAILRMVARNGGKLSFPLEVDQTI